MTMIPHGVRRGLFILMVLVEDFLAFGSVCKAWRLAAAKENFTAGLTHQVPLLFMPPRDNYCTTISARNVGEFYSVRNDKTHKLSLAETKISEVCSSSLGWLITVYKDCEVGLSHLLNHYPMVKLPNPPNNIYTSYCSKKKFVLSSSPSSTSNYVVMAILNTDRLLFCRPGDDAWTLVVDEGNQHHQVYHDITYYKNQFYVVDRDVSVCDTEVNGKQERKRVINGKRIPKKPCYFQLLSGGIKRGLIGDSVRPLGCSRKWEFRVFEVPFDDNNWSDSKVTDLGNRTLFLGLNSSFSVEVSTFSRCKPNCIYITNDELFLDFKWGVFSMADKKMNTYSQPCLWIQPSV